MRSLTPTTLHIVSLDAVNQGKADGQLGGITVDPEDGTGYAVVERPVDDRGLELDVVRVTPGEGCTVITTFDTPALAPFPLPSHIGQVVDIHYFPDDRSLTILLAGGDIATLSLSSGGTTEVDIVGSVDSGIKAAAWSPDDEQLVLITGEDELVVMTRHFDTLHEEPLRSEQFGEDGFINVGWGSKTTQFHGSLGKAAAQAGPSTPSSLSHHSDHGLPRITFRGDAAYFAISSLDPYSSSSSQGRRQVRIYSRDASAGFVPKLSATSEALPGLEGELSWRPSGNLISGLVRYGYEGGGEGREGRWDVAMLERNGLRHGGFELRESKDTWQDGRIRGMAWNCDSEVLAIWIERTEEDVVQLWSMKNYHYYLKQEIFSHRSDTKRLKGFKWHPEQPLVLYIIGTNFVQIRSFAWDTYSARRPMPHDTASVVVVDGNRLLITPFRTQNVPPPMSSYTIALPSTPVHISLSETEDSLVALFSNGDVQLWDLNTRLPDQSGSKLRGGGKVAEPQLRWNKSFAPEVGQHVARHVVLGPEGQIGALFWAADCAVLRSCLEGGDVQEKVIEGSVERILWSHEFEWLALDDQGVLRDVNGTYGIDLPICQQPISIIISSDIVLALSASGKLHLASLQPHAPSPTTLATSVTSFTLTGDYLIYTTSSQASYYAPIPILQRMAEGEEVAAHEMDWESRRVERGSLAVVACPSSMSLVLQMPRGNLETVYPRPLVLAVIRRDVLSGQYRSAYLTCRKHRLDLNVLYDLNPKQLMANLPKFVEQIPEVDYLNLFVSSLSSTDSSKELYRDLARGPSSSSSSEDKVNSVCDALRGLLEKDTVKYIETILTTHVCKQPADYESGLRVLLQVQKDHQDIVEDAIKYMIFLSNVNQLYDVALGMYNFQLVLMVAQYSQKDPKEYLPFLRELRALDKWEQRFRIDDHLGRRASALGNLKQAGPERFDEAASYLARYELYDEAFKLYADDEEHLIVINDLYGDYLYDRRDFTEAAIAYSFAGKPDKAMKAYEKAHSWRELFTLALEQKIPQDKLLEMCTRVTDHLSSRGASLEASRVLVEYAKDVDSAIEVLCRGSQFAEAYRLASLHDRSELVGDVIEPALLDTQEALAEVFEEMEGQLDKEMARLKDLRVIRETDPDTFYIVDNEPALEGVDVATNATTTASAFTRYTVAPTVFSQSTKITGQTAKSRHKPSRRRAAGRKGTVDEYEYLLGSLGRLVIRVDEKSSEAIPILRHLVLVTSTSTSEHRQAAKDLQSTIIKLRTKLAQSLSEAWKDREEVLDSVEASGGMGLSGEIDKARAVEKPEVEAWIGLGVLAR
ncbi:putative Pol II transcription elongation factor [Naematelia encephala]|uniref:Elongator complex protein 1 n=1 Tax=Naematelia encephala TaxID=71784 RepID=A0A1Y2AF03_9TREE|nr:putative Pol II transcription elongation factor [Naematelia encephala]